MPLIDASEHLKVPSRTKQLCHDRNEDPRGDQKTSKRKIGDGTGLASKSLRIGPDIESIETTSAAPDAAPSNQSTSALFDRPMAFDPVVSGPDFVRFLLGEPHHFLW